MYGTNGDHFNVIKDCLSNGRAMDEDAMSSVAVLAERLERLKKTSSLFADIMFSPQVEELAQRELVSAIS